MCKGSVSKLCEHKKGAYNTLSTSIRKTDYMENSGKSPSNQPSRRRGAARYMSISINGVRKSWSFGMEKKVALYATDFCFHRRVSLPVFTLCSGWWQVGRVVDCDRLLSGKRDILRGRVRLYFITDASSTIQLHLIR